MKKKTKITVLALLLLASVIAAFALMLTPPSPPPISIVPNHKAEQITAIAGLAPPVHHQPLLHIVICALAVIVIVGAAFVLWLNRWPERTLAAGWNWFTCGLKSSREFVKANLGMLTFFCLACIAGWSGLQLATNCGVTATFYAFVISSVLIAVQLAVASAHLRGAGYISSVAGILLLVAGQRILDSRSAQIEKYNQAMIALDKHDLAREITLLDESSQAYQSRQGRSQLFRLIFGEPSLAVEARAQFHKGVALFLQNPQKNAKEAAAQYWKSLRLNPGNQYAKLATPEAERRYDDALNAKFNMEVAENSGGGGGKAKGKAGDQPGQKQQPESNQLNDPSKQAGKQSNDTL